MMRVTAASLLILLLGGGPLLAATGGEVAITVTVVQICIGDINGDGIVDAADLAELLGAWGTSDEGADLNNDGIVNAVDLAILLGAWGPCGTGASQHPSREAGALIAAHFSGRVPPGIARRLRRLP